jgi:hypothetical protein
MKKTFILLMLMAVVYQLKAQQNLFQFKPADTSATHQLYKRFFGEKPDNSLNWFTPQLKLYSMQLEKSNDLAMISYSIVDNMPIVRLSTNSKMPVIRPLNDSKMPVVNPNQLFMPVKP